MPRTSSSPAPIAANTSRWRRPASKFSCRAPEGEYQLTTGTSVAAAEVSGIVALLLERNPKLTPADIRRILTLSARRLAPGEQQFWLRPDRSAQGAAARGSAHGDDYSSDTNHKAAM